MDHRPQAWGRPRDDVYGPYDAVHLQHGPKTVTQHPMITGASVIAVKFAEGVVIAADNLASYGSLARFQDVKRLYPFANTSVIGVGGDISDMQHLHRVLNTLAIEEDYTATPSSDDSTPPSARITADTLYCYLTRLYYNRRSRFDPLWNRILIAGLHGTTDAPFLGSVDLLGSAFQSPAIASGLGAHLAIPILRNLVPDDEAVARTSRDEAVAAIRECMKVLYYRDARSLPVYSLAVVTKDGVELLENEKVEKQNWAFAELVRGYGAQTV